MLTHCFAAICPTDTYCGSGTTANVCCPVVSHHIIFSIESKKLTLTQGYTQAECAAAPKSPIDGDVGTATNQGFAAPTGVSNAQLLMGAAGAVAMLL
jgi:hypothetical protein